VHASVPMDPVVGVVETIGYQVEARPTPRWRRRRLHGAHVRGQQPTLRPRI